MKIISWNVNGIRSVWEKGFIDFVKKENPDVICLQEIKTDHEYTNLTNNTNLKNYYKYWNFAKKKGYSGTAVFIKHKYTDSTNSTNLKPLKATKGIGSEKFDSEGRVLTLEFDNFILVNAYFPHSRRELERLDYKLKFNEAFLSYTKSLQQNRHSGLSRIVCPEGFPSSGNDNAKSIIIAGDLNVAHKEIDLANPKQNIKNAGFTPEERVWMDRFLRAGFIDTFREFTKDGGHYTWWTWRANARARNIGWRIDYFLISQNLRSQLISSKILPNVFGSDHCPIKLEMDS